MTISLTSTLGDVGKFLTAAVANPNASPAVKTALADITTAVKSTEAAVPEAIQLLVDTEVNALLAKIPVLVVLAQPEVDALANAAVDALLGLIYAKLGLPFSAQAATTTAVPSTASVQAADVMALNNGVG